MQESVKALYPKVVIATIIVACIFVVASLWKGQSPWWVFDMFASVLGIIVGVYFIVYFAAFIFDIVNSQLVG